MPSQMDMVKLGLELRACNKMVIAAAVIVFVSAILSISSVATLRWKAGEVAAGLGHYKEGLFGRETCNLFATKCQYKSFDLNALADWQRAVQAFALIGTLLMVFACIISPCVFCGVWDKFPAKGRTLALLLAIICIAAAIAMFLTIMTYGVKSEGRDLQVSYGLAVLVTALNLTSGIIFAVCYARDIDVHT